MPAGRTEYAYSDDLIYEIFAQLEHGKSLLSIFKANPHYPDITTFYDHLNRHRHFDDRYRDIRANTIAKWIEKIEDEAQNVQTTISFETNDGTKVITNSAAVQKVEMQMRVAKWIGGLVKPRRYGNEIAQEIDLRGDTPEERLESVVDLVKRGEITADEGGKLTSLIKSQIEVCEIKELGDKVSILTQQIEVMKKGMPVNSMVRDSNEK